MSPLLSDWKESRKAWEWVGEFFRLIQLFCFSWWGFQPQTLARFFKSKKSGKNDFFSSTLISARNVGHSIFTKDYKAHSHRLIRLRAVCWWLDRLDSLQWNCVSFVLNYTRSLLGKRGTFICNKFFLIKK